MSRGCSICAHPKRAEIEAEASAEDGSDVDVAARHGVSKVALRRHASHAAAPPDPAPPPLPAPEVLHAVAPPSAPPTPAPAAPPAAAPCAICGHAKRQAIEDYVATGAAWSTVARTHLVSAAAVRAHAEGCLGGALRKTPAAAVLDADGGAPPVAARARCLQLLQELDALATTADRDLEASYRDRVQILAARTRALELLGKLTGELGQTENQLVASPHWARLEAAISEALAPFPEAAQAVAQRLLALEGGS